MLVGILIVVGFVLLAFVLPMWLTTRKGRGKSFTGPLPREIDYDNPYPGAAFWKSKD